MGFVVDKVALGQVFSEYFGFPCQSSFHQLLHNHPHLSPGAGIIGQKRPQYKGLSPTPLAIKKKLLCEYWCEEQTQNLLRRMKRYNITHLVYSEEVGVIAYAKLIIFGSEQIWLPINDTSVDINC
jgi:hypothetical protein